MDDISLKKKYKKPKQMRENKRMKKSPKTYIYKYKRKKKGRRETVAQGTILSKMKETKAV